MEKNNIVNYSEFNKVHKPRADHLVSFVKLLDGAVQKSDAYESVMKQLRCIGWSDELIQTACEAATYYKEHYKRLIQEEQCPSKTVSSGDKTFVVCRETRYPGSEACMRAVVAAATSHEEAEVYMRNTFANIRKEFAEATKCWWEQHESCLPPIVNSETSGSSCRVELLDFNCSSYFAALWIECCTII